MTALATGPDTVATATIRASHKPIQIYYKQLQDFDAQGVGHESATRMAFQNLLAETAKPHHWTLIPELSMKVEGKTIRPDGTLRDEWKLHKGYWEAKDPGDNLNEEIRKKVDLGYPVFNTIFENNRQGVLYQNGVEANRIALKDQVALADLLNQFYDHTERDHVGFEQAVTEFKERVPQLAVSLLEKIRAAHEDNNEFVAAYSSLFRICQASLNTNISKSAVDEMLVQHLMTERIFDKVFQDQDFVRRNVIAVEIEKVILALVTRNFNRNEFLRSLEPLYKAIEKSARTIKDFSQKQYFLNTVYERFFQGYSVKLADTHGIVYTPQVIVDFMCASVREVLLNEFGKELGEEGVHILDPCTGTGNFIVNLLNRIPRKDLSRAYRSQFFANEVMLLPYYIASVNIEHAYYELTGIYEPFEGMCFVDTLDLVEKDQRNLSFMSEANTIRVGRQKRTPITVIIGNPPYNMGQINENDNNKNRKYEHIDRRIKNTYVADSSATLNTKLYDAYIKFFRWCSDRLQGREGIVCLVSNNGFLRGLAFDGFRKHLCKEFDSIYHLDFKGNARTSGERRRQEGGNIFSDQIRVGVGITVLTKNKTAAKQGLSYHCVGDYWTAVEKEHYLNSFETLSDIPWENLVPDSRGNWLSAECSSEFDILLPLGSKATKAEKTTSDGIIFKTYSPGVNSARDAVVYGHQVSVLAESISIFNEAFNSEVDRFKRSKTVKNIDDFVNYEKIKWSRTLKSHLRRGIHVEHDPQKIKQALYRPFDKRFLYHDDVLIDCPGLFRQFLPTPQAQAENHILCIRSPGSSKEFHCLITNVLPDFHLTGDSRCFPFYVYNRDGTNRRENIVDWALTRFRNHYGDSAISKWEIFQYVYAVLHQPVYREKFADSLKRELPRIPFVEDFRTFADAGERLSELHLNYEQVAPWPLKWITSKNMPMSYRVEKMKLCRDRTEIVLNPTLALSGIPPETFEYRLGNRSALEWVIDQYQVSTDKRSGILTDPNRKDDPEYIVRLVGQVVRVSVETVRIVKSLPPR